MSKFTDDASTTGGSGGGGGTGPSFPLSTSSTIDCLMRVLRRHHYHHHTPPSPTSIMAIHREEIISPKARTSKACQIAIHTTNASHRKPCIVYFLYPCWVIITCNMLGKITKRRSIQEDWAYLDMDEVGWGVRRVSLCFSFCVFSRHLSWP